MFSYEAAEEILFTRRFFNDRPQKNTSIIFLSKKVTAFFRPYATVTRGEMAEFIDLTYNMPLPDVTGQVLGVTYSRLDNIVFTARAYLSAMVEYIHSFN